MSQTQSLNKSHFSSSSESTTSAEQKVLSSLDKGINTQPDIEISVVKPGWLTGLANSIKHVIRSNLSREAIFELIEQQNFELTGERRDSCTKEHIYIFIITILATVGYFNALTIEDLKYKFSTTCMLNGLHPLSHAGFYNIFPESTLSRVYYELSNTIYKLGCLDSTGLLNGVIFKDSRISKHEFLMALTKAVKHSDKTEAILAYKSISAENQEFDIEILIDNLIKAFNSDNSPSLIEFASTCSMFSSTDKCSLNRTKLLSLFQNLFEKITGQMYHIMRKSPFQDPVVEEVCKNLGVSDLTAMDGSSASLIEDNLTPISHGTVKAALKTHTLFSVGYNLPIFNQVASGTSSERAFLQKAVEFVHKTQDSLPPLLITDAGYTGDHFNTVDSFGIKYLARYASNTIMEVERHLTLGTRYDHRKGMTGDYLVLNDQEENKTISVSDFMDGNIHVFKIKNKLSNSFLVVEPIFDKDNNVEKVAVFITNIELPLDDYLNLIKKVHYLLVAYRYRWKIERYFAQIKENTCFENCNRACPYMTGSLMIASIISDTLNKFYSYSLYLSNMVKNAREQGLRSISMSDIKFSWEKASKGMVNREFFIDFLEKSSKVSLTGHITLEAQESIIAQRTKLSCTSVQNIAHSYDIRRMNYEENKAFHDAYQALSEKGLGKQALLFETQKIVEEAQAKEEDTLEEWVCNFCLPCMTYGVDAYTQACKLGSYLTKMDDYPSIKLVDYRTQIRDKFSNETSISEDYYPVGDILNEIFDSTDYQFNLNQL